VDSQRAKKGNRVSCGKRVQSGKAEKIAAARRPGTCRHGLNNSEATRGEHAGNLRLDGTLDLRVVPRFLTVCRRSKGTACYRVWRENTIQSGGRGGGTKSKALAISYDRKNP